MRQVSNATKKGFKSASFLQYRLEKQMSHDKLSVLLARHQ